MIARRLRINRERKQIFEIDMTMISDIRMPKTRHRHNFIIVKLKSFTI